MVEINWRPTERQLRQFSCVLLPAFLTIIGLVAWHRSGRIEPAVVVLWATAAAVALVGWVRPSWLRPVFVAVMLAAFPVGWVVSHLMLAAAFYLVFTPVGLLLRCFGYDPLERKFEPEAATYWVPRKGERDVRSYFRQY